jgi:rod shape-determining protein MreD
MTLRIFVGLAIVIAVYVALAIEATTGGRTLLPHGPVLLLILAAWSLPATSAVLVAALLGLACDAIGTASHGPSLMAAAVAALIAGEFRRRWELDSMLAVILFATGVALAFLVGGELVFQRFSAAVVPVMPVEILAGRAVATAFAALAVVLLARLARKTTSGVAAMLLSH